MFIYGLEINMTSMRSYYYYELSVYNAIFLYCLYKGNIYNYEKVKNKY